MIGIGVRGNNQTCHPIWWEVRIGGWEVRIGGLGSTHPWIDGGLGSTHLRNLFGKLFYIFFFVKKYYHELIFRLSLAPAQRAAGGMLTA